MIVGKSVVGFTVMRERHVPLNGPEVRRARSHRFAIRFSDILYKIFGGFLDHPRLLLIDKTLVSS